MKLIINFLVTIVFCAIVQIFFPWWSVAAVAFVVGYFLSSSGWNAFLSGFLALFVLWGGYALFLDMGNERILSTKVAEIFRLPSSYLLILLTSVIGGITAGFASLTGKLLKDLF